MPESDRSTALAAAFRAAMRRQASTVCVLSVGEGAARRGMTATAVMSLTAEPPTIIAAVNRSASLAAHADEGVAMTVNFLSHEHQALARDFAGGRPPEDRFESGDWRQCATGAPYLADSVASLVCILDRRIDYETHSLLICRVEAVHLSENASPLLYVDGGFARLRPEAS